MKREYHFKECIFSILLLSLFLLSNMNLGLAQTIGQKYIMEIAPNTKKFPVFEQTNVTSAMLGVVRNYDTVKVLQKNQDWIKISFPSGKMGWVKYYSSGSDFESWKFVPFSASKSYFPQSQQNPNPQDINARLTILENKVRDLEAILIRLNAGVSTASTASSPPPKPTEDEIKSAIAEHLKRNVPITWSGSLMGGTNGHVEYMEIIQIGIYNDQMRYWPVKARVRGSCDADLITKKERHSFDKIGDFKIFQDDYGNWQASIETVQ